MPSTRVVVALVLLFCWSVYAQWVPIHDRVYEPILPTGISESDLTLGAELAFFFKNADDKDVVHLVGDAQLKLGRESGLRLTAQEIVVWIENDVYDGRPFNRYRVFLWRNGEVVEVGGTVTSSPALFVSLSSFGELRLVVEDVTDQSSAESVAYREGDRIRTALLDLPQERPDEDVSLRVFDAAGYSTAEAKKAPPVIKLQTRRVEMDEVESRPVIIATGGVYMSRGAPEGMQFLEMRADSVVVLLPLSKGTATTLGGGGSFDGVGEIPGHPDSNEVDWPKRRLPDSDRSESFVPKQRLASGFGEVEVEAVYLEGDVIMSQNQNTIRAARLYYDFVSDRALILDAAISTTVESRHIPISLRAEAIRQLSSRHFSATDAVLTTSDFHTPHYHVGASEIDFINRTSAEPSGRLSGVESGSFRIRHATLNLSGVPVFYWPFIYGHIDASETSIRNLRAGYSDDFGFELETDWQLFNVLGFETPRGFDSTLSLDFYSDRGPGIGVDADYQRDTYFGELKSYLIQESGEDILGRERNDLPDYDGPRGRFLWRHRHFLEEGWEVSFELSYISDEQFLEEFFEQEFDNGKEQETLLYLKKQRDNWAFTMLMQSRILDFYTQTESVPDFSLQMFAEPIWDGGSYYTENRVGMKRYLPADQTFLEFLRDGEQKSSGMTARADSRHEVGWPVDLGPMRFVPFVSLRGTAWDDTNGDSGKGRIFGTVGVRGSMHLWRMYTDAQSELLDIDGIRHVIKPDFVVWAAGSNIDSHELHPFDEQVELIDDVDGVSFGLRQRWQTKRGVGDNRRIVDLLTLDLQMGVFNDAQRGATTNGFVSFTRPEYSIARNYVSTQSVWRINDQTALLSESSYDMNDRDLDIQNVSLVVERSPRLSYLLGYRYIGDENSNLFAFDANYKLTSKYTVAIRELYDIDRKRTLDFTVGFIRRFPRWYAALSFRLDEAEDDFGVSLSVWPEGLPQAALGSRRFTGLSETTRVQRD